MTTESLFLEPPVFEKAAGLELSPDSTSWETEIVVHVHETLPYIASHELAVRLEKIDDKTGYGYGYLTIGNQGQTKVHAPLIIQDWELHPIDVFIQNDEFFPMNEDRLQEALFDNRTFAGSMPAEESSGGYAQNYPPHSGKYVYASAQRKGSILAAIDGTIMPEDRQFFLDKLAGDERLLANYQAQGLLDMVKRAGGLRSPDRVPGSKPVYRVLKPSVVQIEKVGYDKFLVRSVSDRLYCPVERGMGGDEVLAKFGQDTLTHVLENGEYSTICGERPVTPIILEGLTSELKKLTNFGRCEVRTSLNDCAAGWLFPRVVSFDGEVLGPDKLFTDGQSIWGLQQDIAGREIEESDTLPEEPPCSPICMGATGVFYHHDDRGQAFCTLPFTIISSPVDLGDMIRMEVRTALGEGLIFEITSGTDSIVTSRKNRLVRFIPARMKFCCLGKGKPQRLQDDPQSVVKFAQANLKEHGVIQVSSMNDGQSYSLAGTYEDTLEGGGSNLPRTRAKFHLMSLGMTPSNAESALDKAKCNGRVTVINLQPLMTEREKESSVRREVIEPLLAALPSLKTDLIKEASFFEDSNTVDSVLSLNFVNLENVKTFMEFLPQLKEASSQTAQLLVASRLGFGAIPKEAAKKAMDNLERVISNLEHLRAATQANNTLT